LGTFNRITFPAFLMIPLLQLLPHVSERPAYLMIMLLSGFLTLLVAVVVDTEWYTSGTVSLSNFTRLGVFTPWNNLVYNFDPRNLAQHGLHPYYQHLLINLPQLLGPAFILLLFKFRPSTHLYSALSGVTVLSCFQHQEARFLMPAIPLILSSVDLPRRFAKVWVGSWVVFNVLLGLLMGVYHQGGIVPGQLWLAEQDDISQAFWWKTLSPPTYLLGEYARRVQTHDLMGRPGANMTDDLLRLVPCGLTSSSVLVAPHSATYLDNLIDRTQSNSNTSQLSFEHIWTYRKHLNMDDIDPLEEGFLGTWHRIVGRRGLGIWKITRTC